MKLKPADMAELADALGRMKVTEWPSARAAGLAAELVDELRSPTKYGRCAACGWPNKPDGCCSRPGCCNTD